MSWHDARHAASVILYDALNLDGASAALQQRAARVVDGTGNMTWDDRGAMARALTIGAKVLGL